MSEYLLLRHDRPARGEQYGQKVERTAADFDRSSVTKEQTRARKQLKAPEPNCVFARISSEGRISPDGVNFTAGSRPKRLERPPDACGPDEDGPLFVERTLPLQL